MGRGRVDTTPEGFFDTVVELMLAGDPRVRRLGPTAEAGDHIRRRAASIRTRAWNMQISMTVNQIRVSEATRREHPGPEDFRLLLPPDIPRTCPLYATSPAVVRLGRVPGPLFVSDDDHVFLAGPAGTPWGQTIWDSRDPEVVAAAAGVYRTCWAAARRWQEVDQRPPLSERRVEVAMLLADGASDVEIASAVGVSARTASSEVHAVTEWLGARSRGHATALLVGAAR